MSDYPSTICVSPESSRQPISGRIAEISEGGIPRYQERYSESLYQLTIVHPAATTAEMEEIRAHWVDNRYLEFYFSHIDGHDYRCRYTDEPTDSYVAPGRWRIEIRLLGVLDDRPYGYLLFDDGGQLLLANGGGIKI